jgi:hypothetical protein
LVRNDLAALAFALHRELLRGGLQKQSMGFDAGRGQQDQSGVSARVARNGGELDSLFVHNHGQVEGAF